MRSSIAKLKFTNCSDDEAMQIAHRLIELECRGRGDLEGALHRLSKRSGISYWTWKGWWQAKSKPHGPLLRRTFEVVARLYETEVRRQLGKLQQELEQARRVNRELNSPTLDATISVAGVVGSVVSELDADASWENGKANYPGLGHGL